MKNTFYLSFFLILFFAACKKSSNDTNNSTYPAGISAKINGKYTTFNHNISVDTSSGEISITASADSTPYTSSILEIVLDASESFKPGVYSYQSSGPYTSGLGIATTIDYSQVLFGSYDDSVTVATVTSSTVTGSFHGTINGKVIDFNSPNMYDDSVAVLTEGKFNVKW